MINAHGATYQNEAEANARIAELNELNLQIGASDGRVTEIMCIMDALEAHEVAERKAAAEARIAAEKATKAAAKPAAPAMGELTAKYVAEAEADLASIKRTGYDDGKWRYLKVITPEGRTTAREYRTQKGFLTAYVREARRGSDILIAE
jgi:hypothetical protein